MRLGLKIEINTREHFTALGVNHVPFTVENPWFTGTTNVTIYAIEELLATKLRALYQRNKGRDLFDLWHVFTEQKLDSAVILSCFERYMKEEGRKVTRALFEENLAGKRLKRDFRDDIEPLLRSGFNWNFEAAMDTILENFVAKLPGAAWKGK